MAELPSGTVTFLFTDIEGSTALLKQLGEGYGDILAEHQRLLREAFAAHGGHEIDTQGDSFFVAFRRAKDGVAAAVDAQRALAKHEWPEAVRGQGAPGPGLGPAVKVRMGLHSGEPVVGDERYVGLGVHRAARVGAIGHGGQVLLSSATRELVEDDLPPGVSLRDLGAVRLKDIDRPERISMLVVEGLPSKFPRLKTYERPPFYRRRGLLAGALAGVIAAAIAIPIFALGQGGSGGGLTLEGNAVAEIDPHSNKVIGQVPVGSRPGQIAFGSGSLWVANLDDQTVSRIDPSKGSVTRNIHVTDTPTGLAASPGATWVVGSDRTRSSVSVRRIDPQFDNVAGTTRIGNVVPGGPGAVAASGGAVWVAPSSGLLSRLDPQSRIVQRIDPNAGPAGVAVGAGAVWVTDSDANTVTRVDPTGLLTPIAVGHSPSGIAVGAGFVWVADTLDDEVVRIDPGTRAVTTTIPVGRAPLGIAFGAGSVWVANSGDGTVTRIDPAARKVLGTIEVGGSPQGIVAAGGRAWVTVDTRTIGGAEAAQAGGTARLNAQEDIDYADPALSYYPQGWQLLYATCAKLLNYPDKPAPAGSELEPEVAQSLPARSAHGKTYTFTIRKGFRFSPPSNEPVTAETFKYAIERSLSPRMRGPALVNGYLRDVVGADAYTAGKATHIAGVTARGNSLTIRLVAPAPNLPARLAMPFFCAVPIGTPLDPKGVRVIPSAGPYYVTSYTPGQGLVLQRNPSYTGTRPHRLDRIEVTVGVSRHKTLDQIAAGSVDYALDGVDPADAAGLAARLGPQSPAAKKGRQQYFINPSTELDFLAFNTHRPLFHDARLRRAVNYAIDRSALARLGNFASSLPDRPTDQQLPPGIPGFRDVHIYPFTPDLARAKRLAGEQRRSAVLYTCDAPPCDRLAQVVKTNLAAIGIDVQVKAFAFSTLFERLPRKGEPFDLTFNGWASDYPDPYAMLNVLLEAPGLFPTLDDPVFKRRLAAAAQLSGPRRYLTYGKLDADLARNAAPFVAYGNAVDAGLFSARMGCQVYQPVYGMDLAALCLRKKS